MTYIRWVSTTPLNYVCLIRSSIKSRIYYLPHDKYKIYPIIIYGYQGSEETAGIFGLHFIGDKTETLVDLTQSKEGGI
jgi:hypothetical protein